MSASRSERHRGALRAASLVSWGEPPAAAPPPSAWPLLLQQRLCVLLHARGRLRRCGLAERGPLDVVVDLGCELLPGGHVGCRLGVVELGPEDLELLLAGEVTAVPGGL